MVYKLSVLDAFGTLGLDIDKSSKSEGAKAYKKLALAHHPDRNHGDPTAHERFQKIGAAWSICLKHYDNPASSEMYTPPPRGAAGQQQRRRYFDEDADVPLDEEEEKAFFQFLFEQMMRKAGFSYKNAHEYRKQRSGAFGDGVHFFTENFAQRQESQEANTKRQAREREEYLQRVKEFEEECAAEQREIDRQAALEKQAQNELLSAKVSAWKAAKVGNGDAVKVAVTTFNINVNGSEKNPKPPKALSQKQKTEDTTVPHDTLLHAAAHASSESCVDTMTFLLSRGGDLSLQNKLGLTPFHVAILHGSAPLVKFFLSQRPIPQGCHHSKAAGELDGRTPLQLAIASGNTQVIHLLLKDATVHNVEACVENGDRDNIAFSKTSREGQNWATIRSILVTKKGFSRPSEGSIPGLSKKARKKLEQAEEEADFLAAKAQRIAEENARAVEKAKLKQERAAKRAQEEREKQEERAVKRAQEEREKQEELERQRLLEEVERKKAEAITEAQRKAAAKGRREAAKIARQNAEKEALRLAQEKARREEDARHLAQLDVERKSALQKERLLAKKARGEQRAKEEQAKQELTMKIRVEKEVEDARRTADEAIAARRAERERKRQQVPAGKAATEGSARRVEELRRAAAEGSTEELRKEQELSRKRVEELELAEKAKILALEQEREKAAAAAATTNTSRKSSRTVCKNFLKGHCVFGVKCRHRHTTSNKPSTSAVNEKNKAEEARKTEALQQGQELQELRHRQQQEELAKSLALEQQKKIDASALIKRKSRSTCRQFLKGNCAFGENCRYSHAQTEDQPSQQSKVKLPKKRNTSGLDDETIKRRAQQSARDKEKRIHKQHRTVAALPTPSTTPSPPRTSTNLDDFRENFQTVAVPDDLFAREPVIVKSRHQINREALARELAKREREVERMRALLAKVDGV